MGFITISARRMVLHGKRANHAYAAGRHSLSGKPDLRSQGRRPSVRDEIGRIAKANRAGLRIKELIAL